MSATYMQDPVVPPQDVRQDAAVVQFGPGHCDSRAMENPPLWCAGLAPVTATNQAVLWLALHHCVADGVSLSVLADEFSILLEGGTPCHAGYAGASPSIRHYSPCCGTWRWDYSMRAIQWRQPR